MFILAKRRSWEHFSTIDMNVYSLLISTVFMALGLDVFIWVFPFSILLWWISILIDKKSWVHEILEKMSWRNLTRWWNITIKGGKNHRERERGREVLLDSILRWLVNFYFCKPSQIASLPKKTLVHPSTINIAW
jgi:hypothetical protein